MILLKYNYIYYDSIFYYIKLFCHITIMNQTLYNISYNIIQETWNNNIDTELDINIEKDIIYNNLMNGMNNYIIIYIFLIMLW